ncbi:hypothetical protein Tco_1205259 [Tanacetum coccineum]
MEMKRSASWRGNFLKLQSWQIRGVSPMLYPSEPITKCFLFKPFHIIGSNLMIRTLFNTRVRECSDFRSKLESPQCDQGPHAKSDRRYVAMLRNVTNVGANIITGDSYMWPIAQPDVATQDDARLHNSCSSSIDISPGVRQASEGYNQQQKLKMMDHVDVETDGATTDDTDRLLKYDFNKIGDFKKQSEEILEDLGGSMIEYECDTLHNINATCPFWKLYGLDNEFITWEYISPRCVAQDDLIWILQLGTECSWPSASF